MSDRSMPRILLREVKSHQEAGSFVHSIKAPNGYRVVSGAVYVSEDSHPDRVTLHGSIPIYDDENFQLNQWNFEYAVTDNTEVQMSVICERSVEPDVLIYTYEVLGGS